MFLLAFQTLSRCCFLFPPTIQGSFGYFTTAFPDTVIENRSSIPSPNSTQDKCQTVSHNEK